ncbi:MULTISPECIES: hypothetical protein [unclassified Exiguobacterium]|uniref:hypothetical protein n=1 Tax=unclassified Exiguobacterium TaxID=2644629 RepID=UPI001EEF7D17|nr:MULTISPECIES: hypothetical protein [unclassified Exiguobacterium]
MKIAVVLITVVLLLIPLNNFVKESWAYNNNRGVLAFQEDPFPLDIINLGTSHAMFGYAFKPLGLSHLDLALPSQTIEYDFKMLKQYDEHLRPGGVVIVSLSQITFSNVEIGRKENYYQVLDQEDIEPVSTFDYYTYTSIPALNSGSVYTALSREIRDFRWESHKPWVNNGKNYSERKYEMVEAQYKQAVENRDIEQNMKQLQEIIDYCEQQGYNVVLAMEPVHESYHAYFDEDVMERHVFQHLEALDLDIPFLNYMGDQRFVSNKDYFHNPDHLNGDGRKLLSSLVYEDLKRLGYL